MVEARLVLLRLKVVAVLAVMATVGEVSVTVGVLESSCENVVLFVTFKGLVRLNE